MYISSKRQRPSSTSNDVFHPRRHSLLFYFYGPVFSFINVLDFINLSTSFETVFGRMRHGSSQAALDYTRSFFRYTWRTGKFCRCLYPVETDARLSGVLNMG
jgi:hypothetical protein